MMTISNSEDKALKLFVDRIESVNSEIVGLQDDRKDIFAEAKANGYDPRAMREIIRLRKLDPQVRQERQSLVETYMAAFGME